MIYFRNNTTEIGLRSPKLKDGEELQPNVIWGRDYTGNLHSVKTSKTLEFFNLEFEYLSKSSQVHLVNFIKQTQGSEFTYIDYLGNYHTVKFTEPTIEVGTEQISNGDDEISAVITIKLIKIL